MTPRELTIQAETTAEVFWKDIWDYHQLLFIFAWRDLVVRYRQTWLGILWAIITPLLTTFVLTVVFYKLANLPSQGQLPYILLVLSGTLVWNLVANGLNQTSVVFVGNMSLFTKIYFPRIYMPLASLSVVFVDFIIGFLVLIGLCFYLGVGVSLNIVFLPFFVFLALMLALGPGLLFATFNVYYRDFKYVIPFLLQLGMYSSPVGYSNSIVPEVWRNYFSLNPMTGVIGGVRWCLFGSADRYIWQDVSCSILVAAGLLVISWTYFRKMELKFSDVI